MNKEKANKILEEMLESLAFNSQDKRIPEEKKEKIIEKKIKELEVFAKEHGLTFTLPDGLYKDDIYGFFDGTETVEEFMCQYDGDKRVERNRIESGTMFWYQSQYCSY